MGKWGKFDYSEFEKLYKQLKSVQKDMDSFYTEFLTNVILRALAKTKLKTPVDEGLLRNSWQITNVSKIGNGYEVILFNNVEYAVYIEYGHRVMSKGEQVGFVKGKFMMTLSMKEIEQQLPRYLKTDFQKWLDKRVGR